MINHDKYHDIFVKNIITFMIFSAWEEYFGFWKRECFDFEIQTGRRWFCRKEQM